MKNYTNPGTNRTGMATHPIQSRQMLQVPDLTEPSSDGDGMAIAEVRMEYGREAEPGSTMPPPGSLKELVIDTAKILKGEKPMVFVDKLGERMAFERSGVRLYDGVISKFDTFGTWKGGPTREQLVEIRDDELAHMHLVKMVIDGLGSDSSAMTPSANLHATIAQGLPNVIADPRTDLRQCLEAILVAELADNNCWENLIDLAMSLGHDEIGVHFEAALANEQRHLRRVRHWITAAVMLDAGAATAEELMMPPEPGERATGTRRRALKQPSAKVSRKRPGNGNGHGRRR